MWGWLEDLIGEELPKGDGEACKNQAKEWKSLADDLKKLKTDAETAQSTTLLGFIDGQYREGLDPWFNGLIDNIDGLISNFELLAERLEHVGEEIRTTKIRFWVDFALLASNLLVFGGPGLILLKTAAKALAKRLVARAVEKVAFKKITTSAITVAVKRRAATVLSKNFVKKVGVPAAVGAGLGLGQDAARQGILLANHAAVDSNGRPTSQFNLGSTLKAGASGLIMGGIGGGGISK
ncbi:WXG100-like domain-containing protein, partial [Mycobacteroides abscessus]